MIAYRIRLSIDDRIGDLLVQEQSLHFQFWKTNGLFRLRRFWLRRWDNCLHYFEGRPRWGAGDFHIFLPQRTDEQGDDSQDHEHWSPIAQVEQNKARRDTFLLVLNWLFSAEVAADKPCCHARGNEYAGDIHAVLFEGGFADDGFCHRDAEECNDAD